MRIALFGATGRTGRHFVAHALQHGHTLRALVRHPEAARLPAEVQVIAGDMARRDDVATLFRDSDVVVSCAGPKLGSSFSLMSTSASLWVEQMRASGLRRIVVVGGAAYRCDKDVLPEPLVLRVLRQVIPILRDMGAFARTIHASSLDSTVVRPSTLKAMPSRPVVAGYFRKSMAPIGCEDVARFVLSCVEDGSYIRELPLVAYATSDRQREPSE